MYIEKSSQASSPRLWNKFPDHIKLAESKEINCKVYKSHSLKLAYL